MQGMQVQLPPPAPERRRCRHGRRPGRFASCPVPLARGSVPQEVAKLRLSCHGLPVALELRSRVPERTRRQQWTAVHGPAVRALRQLHPRFGKRKLEQHLKKDIYPSASLNGHIPPASLKWRTLLWEPHAVRERIMRAQRPYAMRVPTDKRQRSPPGWLDKLHLRRERRTARRQFTAASFFEVSVARMPFPVQAIQVGGGSEFIVEFEEACQARTAAPSTLPPRCPKLNGRVERLTGTARREFWECYECELDLPTLRYELRAWEAASSAERPH